MICRARCLRDGRCRTDSGRLEDETVRDAARKSIRQMASSQLRLGGFSTG